MTCTSGPPSFYLSHTETAVYKGKRGVDGLVEVDQLQQHPCPPALPLPTHLQTCLGIILGFPTSEVKQEMAQATQRSTIQQTSLLL